MKKYEVLFNDRHTEIMDRDTVDEMITELELFERTDVSQIHELKDNNTLGKTIWTEEEGLFVRDLGFDDDDDSDEYLEV